METKISFASDGNMLEGMYNRLSTTRGAVVTHPHPLYGGDLSNPVVESLVQSFYRKNISTLRFNFRGVGGSEGRHDGGMGEQRDTLAAVRFMLDDGMDSVILAGYSFGSWVIASIRDVPQEIREIILVSPPIAMMPLAENLQIPRLSLVITGEDDDIAPPRLVEPATRSWNPKARLAIIDDADHFFFGSFPRLEEVMHQHLRPLAER